MIYLVDANVLSEPTKATPNAKVVDWLGENERDIAIDSIILGELNIGILSLPAGRKRSRLEQWFETLAATIECLPWDALVSRRWARLVADLKRAGQPVPLLDSMIAASALHHGLIVATRNAGDFSRAGVRAMNPFK
jgi:predicted nucleic acid-binding protein